MWSSLASRRAKKSAARRIPLQLDLKLNLGEDFLFKAPVLTRGWAARCACSR